MRGWVFGHGSCAGVSRHLSLGLWAGEQRRQKDFILSLSSDNIIVPFSLFFRSILPLANISYKGGCCSSSFHTSLFSWACAGTWVQWRASSGVLDGARLACFWLVGWSGAGLLRGPYVHH